MRWINAVWAWPFRFAMYFGPVALASYCAYKVEPWAGGVVLGVWAYVESREFWRGYGVKR